jgi:hypothetical protein
MLLKDLDPTFVFQMLVGLSAFMAAANLRLYVDERRRRRKYTKRWW